MNFEIIPNEQTPKVPEIQDVCDVELLMVDKNLELKEFLQFAETQNRAVGLAANQVSVDGERFMVRAFALRNLNERNAWRLIINPVITQYLGIKELKAEGCLTWKDKMIVAERNRTVIVSYYNQNGEFVENEMHRGFEAQIWQHEINHLNGIEEQIEDPNTFEVPKEIVVGRNEKCPCGSGLKYKHCCLIDE